MKKLVLFGLVISVLALGCSDDDEDLCGNGKIDDGETCDGDCPLSCDDQRACTVDYIYGRADNCDVVCLHDALTGCFDADGCCPAGCNQNSDSDCSSSCGNDEIEDGETCDPPATCPADCNDANPCTADLMTGSAGNCNVECSHSAIVTCDPGDGCCPAGCNANTDADCSASCGNNEIEDGETCDPPATCPADCIDGQACTQDVMTGSPGNCNVVCTNPPITACRNGDGCCPQNCTSAEDDDCGGGQVDCQFDPQVDWWIIAETLQMESADQGTCVWLSRTNLCPAGMICKAIPFSLDEVRIGHDGQVREYDSSNATLNWSSSWHNWEDSGTIDTGTTVFTLTALNYGHAYEITASGGETWGPILLEPWVP
jgi:hypothetical protein